MNKSNADLILEAMYDMHALEQVCTRETLARETGLKLSIIEKHWPGMTLDQVEGMIDLMPKGGVTLHFRKCVYNHSCKGGFRSFVRRSPACPCA